MMPKHLVKSIIILAFLILSTSLHAQINSDSTNHGININFFNGYAISYKWNRAKNWNYRVYLGLNSFWTNSDEESESATTNNNSSQYQYSRKENEDQNHFHVNTSLSLHFIHNLISKKGYNFYIGVGPNINYSYSSNANNRDLVRGLPSDSSSDIYETSDSRYSVGIGIVSLVGIEVFITKKISFLAESHVFGGKSWGKIERNGSRKRVLTTKTDITEDTNSKTSTSWNASIQLVKFGLGIYF